MANRIGARLATWVRMRRPVTLRNRSHSALGDGQRLRLRCSARGGCSPRCSTRPAACASRPSTASPRRCSRRSRPKRASRRDFQPIEGRAEQELARRTLADLLSDAEATRKRALIEDVQCLSLRLGEKDADRYLMQCARAPEAMAALGRAERIEPRLRAAMDLPEGVGRRFSRASLRRRPLRLRPAAGHRRGQSQLGRADRHSAMPKRSSTGWR